MHNQLCYTNEFSLLTTPYHDRIDNVILVVLECSYCLGSRDIGLLHNQLDILFLHIAIIQLQPDNNK